MFLFNLSWIPSAVEIKWIKMNWRSIAELRSMKASLWGQRALEFDGASALQSRADSQLCIKSISLLVKCSEYVDYREEKPCLMKDPLPPLANQCHLTSLHLMFGRNPFTQQVVKKPSWPTVSWYHRQRRSESNRTDSNTTFIHRTKALHVCLMYKNM